MAKRTVKINIVDDKLFPSTTKAGFAEEHLATKLLFVLPEIWKNENYKYLLKFYLQNDVYYSEELQMPVEFELPQSLMKEGTLYVQLLAKEGTTEIFESDVKGFKISASIQPSIIVQNAMVGLLDHAVERFSSALNRFENGPITLDFLSNSVVKNFMTGVPNHITNLYETGDLLQHQYYSGGQLQSNIYIDSMIFDVAEGDRVFASGFDFTSAHSTVGGGVRICMFNGTTWVKDLTAPETFEKDYIIIPTGVNKISVPFWKDDNNRTFYNYGYSQGAIEKINELSKDVYTTVVNALNLYDATSPNFKAGKYYNGGVLNTNSLIDSMMFDVQTGDRVSASGFKLTSQYSTVGGGVRIGMFNGSVWVKDLTAPETFNKDYIIIPAGINKISVPFWKDDNNRAFYNLSSGGSEETKVSAIEMATATKAELQVVKDMISNNLSGKVVSVLGDSISTFAGYIPAGNVTRYPLAGSCTNVKETWWKRIIDYYGCTLGINDSWASTRVSWDGTESTYVGKNKCISSEYRINRLENNGTPDIIFTFGGTNDLHYGAPVGVFDTSDPSNLTTEEINALPVATFADAYKVMLIRLLKKYPNAKVYCIMPLAGRDTEVGRVDAFCEIIKEACDFFGVPYIDIRNLGITCFNKLLYLPDKVHPNTAGMELIYNKVRKSVDYCY